MTAASPKPAASAAPATLMAEEVYRLVGRTRRVLWMAVARCMEARGDSIFTWHVLCYLTRHGPTAQRDLAYFTAQDPAGISRVMEELVEKKLVRRRADAEDRRRVLVEATAKGRAWFAAASPDVMAKVQEVLGGLTDAQLRQLRDLLETALDGIEGP